MKLDPGMHIGLHLVFFGKTGVTGGVAVRQAPELGPIQGDRVELYDLSFNAPSPSLRGTEGEVSTTPIGRVANCGFLVELLVGGSSGRPCPVR
jgi:hypothetical protein